MATRKIENPDYEKNSRGKIKAKMKAARDSVRKKIQDGYTVPHLAGLAKDVMGGIIMKKPLEEIYKLWDQAVKEFVAANKGNEKEMRKLPYITAKFLKMIDNVVTNALAYIHRVKQANNGYLTETAVLEMRDSYAKKASTLAKILQQINDPEVREAVEYIFITNKPQTAASFKKLVAYLSKVLDNAGGNFSQGEGAIAWFMLAHLPVRGPRSAEEFLKAYIKKRGLKGKELKALLRAGCRHGAASPSLAEQLIKADRGLSFTNNERLENRTIYKVQRDLRKKAKLLARVPYGSTNKTAEMLTLRNVLLAFAAGAAGVSIVGTLAAGIFKGGALKNPGELVDVMLKPPMLMKAGVLVYALAKPKPGFFQGQAEKRTLDEAKTARDLDLITETNPGWASFFTSDKYSGASAFWQFMNEYGMRSNIPNKKDTSIKVKIHKKPQTRKITMISFKRWLDKKAASKDPTGRYAKLAKRIKAEHGGIGSVDGHSTTTRDLRRLSAVFFTWKIGGKASQTEQAYKTALKRARGGYTPPPKKKK